MNEILAIQSAVPLIGPEEGFRGTAYWDVNGWAVGYGFHYYSDGSSVQQGDTMTREEATAYLTTVATQKWNAIRGCITAPINENQAAALIDLAFNCGEGAVCRSTLLQLINSGAPPDQITAQFEQTCTTAGGKYLDVLYNRRVDEVSLFFSSVKQYVKANPATVFVGAGLIFALMGLWIYRAVYKK